MAPLGLALAAAGGKPDAPALQRGYRDVGSPGVRDFIPDRITSATELAAKVAREPGA